MDAAAAKAVVITEMAENDVPGTKLHLATLINNIVTELKCWLTCRGLKLTGTKPAHRIAVCLCLHRGP